MLLPRRLAILLLLSGCTGSSDAQAPDLTSNVADERELSFEGYLYVPVDTSDEDVLASVHAQTKTVFGALRTSGVGVATKELQAIEEGSLSREIVDVVTKEGTHLPMERVRYRYRDIALVPKAMADESTLPIAMVQREDKIANMISECGDPAHAELSGSFWYIFDPSLESCQRAILKEQDAIDLDRRDLTGAQIPFSEVQRKYLPATAQLGPPTGARNPSYPEYERIWSHALDEGVLEISIVSGITEPGVGATDFAQIVRDDGFVMLFQQQEELAKSIGSLAVVDAEGVDLTNYKVGQKEVSGASFADLTNWIAYSRGYPVNIIDDDERQLLKQQVAEKLTGRWITWNAKLQVSAGQEREGEVLLVVKTFYGAETSSAPHRSAIRSSDVFIYNGHSYIGGGPLEARNYEASDFPEKYQLFWLNGCISYNYYNKGFLDLKPGNSQNLDIISTGLENVVVGSGSSVGAFVGRFVTEPSSYQNLLALIEDVHTKKAKAWGRTPNSLLVVDGELDNAAYEEGTFVVSVKSE